MRANACDPVSAFGGIVAVNRAVTRALADGARTGVHRGRRRARRSTSPMRSRCSAPRRTCACSRPVANRRRPSSTCARSTAACSCRTRTPVSTRSVDVARRHQRRADRGAMGRPRVRLAGVRRGEQQRDRVRQGPPGVRDRGRPAEPGRFGAHRRDAAATGGPLAACARATRSSRSATGSTSPPPAGIAAVIQPGGSVRDDEVIAAANEHGIAMVFTGERHFRH